MKRGKTIDLIPPGQATITRSELARLAFCNSKKLPLAINDGGIRKAWVGIGWIEDGQPHGDEAMVIEDKPKLIGRFGIVLPKSRLVILFGKRRLWEKKGDAEFHLDRARGYADPASEMHSAYVGEIRKDFCLEE